MACGQLTLCGVYSGPNDAASTVTSLFTKPLKISESPVQPRPTPVGVYGEKAYYSSSKLLSKYITDYDKEQTLGLAKSLTHHRKKKSCRVPDKENRVKPDKTLDKGDEINKEIKLAKRLLPRDYTAQGNDELQSLTTDDLLVSNPYEGVLSEADLMNSYNIKRSALPTTKINKASSSFSKPAIRNPIHRTRPSPSKNTTCSMHYSEIGTENSSLGDLNRSLQSFNLYSLNGVTYTPHKIKYKTLANGDTNMLSREGCVNGRGLNHSSLSGIKSLSQSTISKRSLAPCTGEHVNTESECVSLSPSNLILGRSLTKTPTSGRHTKYAGRTPYHPGFRRRLASDSELAASDDFDDTLTGKSLDGALEHILSSSDSVSERNCPVPLSDVRSKSFEIRQFMEECLEENLQSDRKSGAVETLKNMLFTLQSMSPRPSGEESSTVSVSGVDELAAGDATRGHRSLEMAMSHLSNLKELVGSE